MAASTPGGDAWGCLGFGADFAAWHQVRPGWPAFFALVSTQLNQKAAVLRRYGYVQPTQSECHHAEPHHDPHDAD